MGFSWQNFQALQRVGNLLVLLFTPGDDELRVEEGWTIGELGRISKNLIMVLVFLWLA